MSRPRLGVGTYGAISVTPTRTGTFRARTRYRDADGTRRDVSVTGPTRAAAEHALKARIAVRDGFHAGPDAELTPDSLFAELVTYWQADVESDPTLSETTKRLYAADMQRYALPALGRLALREIGVARCDRLIKQLAGLSYSRASHARRVLNLAFGLAVRHEILARNPMTGIGRLKRQAVNPEALTTAEVTAVRAAIHAWEHRPATSGPPPDGQLGQIVETMLGTSVRIGEVLALRRRDVDVTTDPAAVRVAGTIICRTGQRPFRQDHPKTSRSRRVIAVPTFAAEALRSRLVARGGGGLDDLVFCTRTGTPLTQANVRRLLRKVLEAAGIEHVTPHSFRRTVATAINADAGVDLAAELLGHTDPRITIQHYIRRSEMVDPRTAHLLDRAFGPGDDDRP